MMKKLKKVEAALFASEEEFEKCVGELADAFIDDLKDQKPNDLEPYEAYAMKVKRDVYLKCKNFRKRFISGFEALQGPIRKEKWAKDEEDKLPPGTVL